ncbi:Predicted secreted protein [Andreprevotia lacus DSM 23236]|jgi:predicted secreted protein|uniref:Predicted secreted protein n=1 Tax=Andreprevotia lacus DSM 23236 TaxID=1121001 RepID=A0A1W1XMQ4_9NEIS|nr:SIMPL domain-containing protein [Andreprevotia lacus]SMC25233.1 Predicted secreted protein [Andreprevotia lacus DSM 23236]
MQRLIASLFVATLATTAWAETLNYNVVNLEANASREVGNDIAYATLFVELTEADPTKLADRVNQPLAQAIKIVKQVPVVQSGGTGYSTYPVYDNKTGKQQGWRGRGELRLSSRDFAALSRVLGQLQSANGGPGLQLADVRYGVSEQQRDQVENELIEESLKAFRQRADLIRKTMAGQSWKVVNINVNTGPAPQPVPVMQRTFKAAAMAADSAPALEGGESRVSVSVNGSVQINE